jgi:hypothetical protein
MSSKLVKKCRRYLFLVDKYIFKDINSYNLTAISGHTKAESVSDIPSLSTTYQACQRHTQPVSAFPGAGRFSSLRLDGSSLHCFTIIPDN